MNLTALSSDELVAEWRSIEAARRALDVRELEVIAEIKARGIASEHGCSSTVVFARHVLRIDAYEAGFRVKAADAFACQRSLTGQPLEPIFPTVAAALAEGAITVRAGMTIASTVEKLPDAVAEGADRAVEAVLVDFARDNDPRLLARHARDVLFALDADGALDEAKKRERLRGCTRTRRIDGSGTYVVEANSLLAEVFEIANDTFGKPTGPDDTRTPAQRFHDALLQAFQLLFTSDRLPSTGGCASTVILTMDADDFATGNGIARTGHGYDIPVQVAKSWLGPETRAIMVLLRNTKEIVAYSSTQRLFTEQQRLAMIARDGGCSYWGCDAPPAWTQAHHATDWKDTHRTSVDDGALACTRDHAGFERMGWKSTVIDGSPHWIPPTFIDPEQRPRRNHLHDRTV